MFRDILPVMREIMTNSILSCIKSGSQYRDNSLWQCGLQLSRILGRVYWILGRVHDLKLPSMNLMEVFRLQTPILFDEHPIDLWFRCSFWSEVTSLCSQSSSRPSVDQEICRLFVLVNHENVFLVWIGCLVTLFLEPSLLAQEIRFWNLHFFILSDQFLRIKFPHPQFFAFSQALSRIKLLSTFPLLQLSPVPVEGDVTHQHPREDILSFLSNCYQLLHSFLLSCAVEIYSKPISERSNSKELFRPLVEILDRSKSFVTHRQSSVSSHFEYPCVFASHLLSGWIGGSLLMPMSQVESLAKLCEVPLAYANDLENFLVEHGSRTTHRDEPKPSHLLILLDLPHLACGISFFSFSTRVFQSWKPLLRILCISRLYSGSSIRSFLLRAWSVSLLDRTVSQSLLADKVPLHWASEFRRCNFSLFSCRSFDVTSYENSNTHPFHSSFSSTSSQSTSSSNFYQSQRLPPNNYATNNNHSPATDTIGKQYQMFSNLCLEKIKVFRDYVLTSDSLWMDPAVVGITSNTAIIATRVDLILDFLHVYCQTMSSSSVTSSPLVADEQTLINLIPNAILSTILSALRILIFLFGYAMEDVIGTSSDTESDCFTNCLNIMSSGFSSIDSICEATPRDHVNHFINSWKTFQKYFVSLIVERERTMTIHDTTVVICREVHLLVSQVSQRSTNLSTSLKNEISRMAGLLEEKSSHPSFVGFVRSPSLAGAELLERCADSFLRS
jgi:hypothetical protein